MKPLIYINTEDNFNVALNLAIEEYVLREMPPADYLILSRNQPSVIIGRNQNMLEEVNEPFLRKEGIPVYRRLSGGGAVYHDPGNLNFSFITDYDPSKLNNYRYFNTPIVQQLNKTGIPAYMNDRNDILVEGRKVSGSAQFSSKGRMISHGTLLFNSHLETLNQALNIKQKYISSKSQKSVRSNVANLSQWIHPPVDIAAFQNLIYQGLIEETGLLRCHSFSNQEWQAIRNKYLERYLKWEWNIGRAPRFTAKDSKILKSWQFNVEISVMRGLIDSFRLEILPHQAETQANQNVKNSVHGKKKVMSEAGSGNRRERQCEAPTMLSGSSPEIIDSDLKPSAIAHALTKLLTGVRYDRNELLHVLEKNKKILSTLFLTPEEGVRLIYLNGEELQIPIRD